MYFQWMPCNKKVFMLYTEASSQDSLDTYCVMCTYSPLLNLPFRHFWKKRSYPPVNHTCIYKAKKRLQCGVLTYKKRKYVCTAVSFFYVNTVAHSFCSPSPFSLFLLSFSLEKRFRSRLVCKETHKWTICCYTYSFIFFPLFCNFLFFLLACISKCGNMGKKLKRAPLVKYCSTQ